MQFMRGFADFFRFMCELLTAVLRDLTGLMILAKVETKMFLIDKKQLLTHDLFRKMVKLQPNKACIVFNDQEWTFKQMEDYSNKVAELFLKKYGLKKGDCVALVLENKPEYVGMWLGLSKIGVISALINTNLRHQQLVHSINVAMPKVVVYSAELENNVNEIKDSLDKDLVYLIDGKRVNGTHKGVDYLNELLERETTGEIVESSEKISAHDTLMYIYTSGTTGLPKPAVIKHNRYSAGGFSFFDAARLSYDDRVFVCLPIYHGNGAIIGMGSSIISGATVVLRKKFSASNFWKECIQYRCTAFIYVGEICRFLVNQPPSPLDREHQVRKAIGNGLRSNVWKEFYQRFNVKCIEFYAASEGNCTMVNITSKLGACGFLPLINRYINLLPAYLIKIDNDMNPIRDERGFCIPCAPGETGLLIGLIGTRAKTAYNGYANNKSASNNKIIENVFKPGQKAFNSGDILWSDRFGYMYFRDRLGDTYRWRGENVATIEVENVISKRLNSREVVVYGVEVPGEEGKTGMAAIVVDENEPLDMNKLAEELRQDLPSYSIPLFVRLVKDIEHTGSFKAKKMKLVEQNYNITAYQDENSKDVVDKTYYFDSKEKTYKELTIKTYQNIINGNMRF